MAGQQDVSKAGGSGTASAKTASNSVGPKPGRRSGHSAANGTGSASDPPHVCGICNKCFDRRDLRDRHKRRCAKSSQKVKVSKRKSCLACAQSKLGCDLDTPSCSRCVSRGTTCEYAVPPPSALSSAASRLPKISTNQPTSQPNYHSGHGTSPFTKQVNGMYFGSPHCGAGEVSTMPVTSSPSPVSGYPTPPFQDSFTMPLHDNFMNNQSFDLFGSLTSQPFLPNDPHTPLSGVSSSIDFEEADTLDPFIPSDISPPFCNWYQEDSIHSDFQIQQHHSPNLWEMSSSTKQEHVRFPHQGIENPTYPLLGALGIAVHGPSVSPAHSPSFVEANPAFLSASAIPFGLDNSGTNDSSSHHTGLSDDFSQVPELWGDLYHQPRGRSSSEIKHESTTGLFNIHSLASFAATNNIKSALKPPFSELDLINLVQRYPAMLLQETFYPPFVHHKLYRGIEGGVVGPLANALCCVSAYANMALSSQNFVYNMINTERERLVRGFQSRPVVDIHALGSLHAMCVYQIIGLLNIKDPAQIRGAELQHPYFLRMAGRLCQEGLSWHVDKKENNDWKSWIFAETLRRTSFLVHIINTLSRRIHWQSASCYQALDDNLIFNLTLPAPDAMWKASTSEEWIEAKKKHDWEPNQQRTIRMVIDRLSEGYSDEENRTWFQVVFLQKDIEMINVYNHDTMHRLESLNSEEATRIARKARRTFSGGNTFFIELRPQSGQTAILPATRIYCTTRWLKAHEVLMLRHAISNCRPCLNSARFTFLTRFSFANVSLVFDIGSELGGSEKNGPKRNTHACFGWF